MLNRKLTILLAIAIATSAHGAAGAYLQAEFGQLLPESSDRVGLWWASSGWKIARSKPVPAHRGQAILIRLAKNEAEAAQLVVRPSRGLAAVSLKPTDLSGPDGGRLEAVAVQILQVEYVNVERPTDKSAITGWWPDPLPPLDVPVDLAAGENQPFWVRVKVPHDTPAGRYQGRINLQATDYVASVPLVVEVFDFALPDRMTCVTAFGFSPGNVYRYHKLESENHRRLVLDKYWKNLSEHHISPYDPAPLERIRVTWPDVRPPESKWQGGRVVKNEKHSGRQSLVIFDAKDDLNVDATYVPRIPIPEKGLRLRFWYRTAIPGQSFLVTLNHHDASGTWIWGGNNDIGIDGDGQWQQFDQRITNFPKAAKSAQLILRAATWTENGEQTGLVWFDDVSVTDLTTGQELIEEGGFEPLTLPPADREKLQVKLNFDSWDRAMQQAIDTYHFNSFRLSIPGMGGGTFHARNEPQLLGFQEDTPHYGVMFESYCRQMEAHLSERGWLDEAYVYWFDEPAPRDYAFVMNGFNKLAKAAPGINRMLTEQVEPALIGGPNIWCPVSNQYGHEPAESRREHGERFWWYVCTGPKAPYCTLFIDHPATELRVWLWQTWQRKIDGILVWQTNYWTSSAAYPDPEKPQNPYEDPMGWRSGYSTPKGEKRPWGNGDGRFIYPPKAAADAHPSGPVLDGPVDSIRWEMLRDGIEDYEYLALLRSLLERKENQMPDPQVAQYAVLLEVPGNITEDMTTFTVDPAPIEARRVELARAIAELSRR